MKECECLSVCLSLSNSRRNWTNYTERSKDVLDGAKGNGNGDGMKSGTCHCCAIGKRFVINCWQRKHQFIVRIIKLQTLRMYLRRDDCRHSLSDDVARRGTTIDSPALLLTIELLLLQCNYIMEFNCKVVVLGGGGGGGVLEQSHYRCDASAFFRSRSPYAPTLFTNHPPPHCGRLLFYYCSIRTGGL